MDLFDKLEDFFEDFFENILCCSCCMQPFLILVVFNIALIAGVILLIKAIVN